MLLVALRGDGFRLDAARRDGIRRQNPAPCRHYQQGRNGRNGGTQQTGTPHPVKTSAADATAEGREKHAGQQNVQRIPAVGGTYFRRPAVSAGTSRHRQFANSGSERTECRFRLGETWNTRHYRAISEEGRK